MVCLRGGWTRGAMGAARRNHARTIAPDLQAHLPSTPRRPDPSPTRGMMTHRAHGYRHDHRQRGAYLLGTHDLPQTLRFTAGHGAQRYALCKTFPDTAASKSLRNKAWLLPTRNAAFC